MRVCLVTLGCDKNSVDNEYLAGILEDRGCEIAPGAEGDGDIPEGLDAVVITTCGFIGDAKAQSVETIVRWVAAKDEQGSPRRVFVAGCLAQRHAPELLKEIPGIDGIAGVGRFDAVADMILAADRSGHGKHGVAKAVHSIPSVEVDRPIRRHRLDAKPYAFLKIADGCDHSCAFCSIPLMKGRLRSVAPDILLEEARALLGQGVRELNLVAQDLCAYGTDRRDGYGLTRLLRDLCSLDGDFWIRCLYCYPGNIANSLIDTMAAEPRIVPYLDLPVQHFDTAILRAMNRPGYAVDAAALVARLREILPTLTLRTTLITGFPGETPAAHARNLDGIRAAQFDWLGVFQYSREEGTRAADAARQVGKPVRERRWHELMELQAQVTAERNLARVGQRARVLLDEYDREHDCWVGRACWHAPEVDGRIHVAAAQGLAAGRFVDVNVIRADVYDLFAELD